MGCVVCGGWQKTTVTSLSRTRTPLLSVVVRPPIKEYVYRGFSSHAGTLVIVWLVAGTTGACAVGDVSILNNTWCTLAKGTLRLSVPESCQLRERLQYAHYDDSPALSMGVSGADRLWGGS